MANICEEEKKSITAVVIRPGKFARIEEIGATLKDMQNLVGGPIEVLSPENGICYVVNEEAKIYNLPLNRAIRNDEGEIFDIIRGTFFVCGEGEEDFESLKAIMARKYQRQFCVPERFIRIGQAIYPVAN